MVTCKIIVLVLLVALSKLCACADYVIPDLKLEALKSGGFRVALLDVPETKKFSFDANLNEEILGTSTGKIKAEVFKPTNGYFVKEFDTVLKDGDVLYYKVFVYNGRLGYRKDNLIWKVKESDLLDSYSVLGAPCKKASTTTKGEQPYCTGQLFISDEFDGTSINTANWIVEQRIPYQDINLYLNTYEDREDTRFIKDGILHLKPVAIHDENEVRSPLDLTNGCTSKDGRQCSFRPYAAFYLPPVKSAKVTSKIPFKYGKIDIRAKLPAGEWIIPVIELELEDKTDGDFSPKIVIAYSRGNDHLTGPKGDDIGSRVLYAGPVLSLEEPQRSQKLIKQSNNADQPYSNDFHIYTLEWLPGKMSFSVDSQLYGSVDTSRGFGEFKRDWGTADVPFNKECLLSLGVAVGGAEDFPDGYSSGNHPRPWDYGQRHHVKAFFDARNVWSNSWVGDNTALQIDYVKVWAV